MAEVRVERRLVAILAADVVGYTRLMAANEEQTLGSLRRHRSELFEPTIDLALDERRRNLEGNPRGQLFHQLGADRAVGGVACLVFEIVTHPGCQRVERFKLAKVFRKIVVEFRQHAPLDALHRHGI